MTDRPMRPAPRRRPRSRRRHRNLGPLLALVLAALVAGCTIPVDENAEALSHEGREEIIDGTTSTTSSTVREEEATRVALYYVLGGTTADMLERVVRSYPPDPLVNTVLADLEQPRPEDIEAYADVGTLTTLIPAGLNARLGDKDVDRGVQPILVNPDAGLRERLETDLGPARLIVGQIVCTVLNVGIEDVSGIEIYDGGDSALPLIDINLELIDGPATVEDFDNCRTASDLLEESEGEGSDGSGSTTTAG